MPFIIYRLLMNRQDHRFVQNCSHLEVRSHQSVGNSHSWELKKKKRRSLKQDLKGSIALSFLSFFLFLIFHYFPFSITHSFSSFGLLLSVSERDIHVPETQKPHPLTVQTFFLVRSSLSEKSRLKGRVAFKGE